MRERLSTVLPLQKRSTVAASADDALLILDITERQQFMEQVHSKKDEEYEIKVSKVLPSSSNG